MHLESISGWQAYINKWAEGKGWNEKTRAFGDECALFHSEISEAYEDFRDGRDLDEIYFEFEGKKLTYHEANANLTLEQFNKAKPCGIPIEIADLMIRLMHFAEMHHIDLASMIAVKMAYNEKRPYRHGGKAT